MLFLIAVGAGAAVLEVHRALHNNPNGDLKELRDREAALTKQLQDVQRDLRSAQQQRDLTEAEAAQLAAVNTRLSAENADLSAASSSLRAENEALAARADSLLERQAALEAAAESLKLENCTLLQQFDRLKIKHEQDAAGFQEQVAELKSAVSGALQRFTSGDISADQLLKFLGAMGVELRCRKESLESLPEQLSSARSSDERLKLLDRVEVQVGDGWMQQMRLVSAEPDRAARLLMAGAAAARAGGLTARGPPAAALPRLAESASAAAPVSSSAPALTHADLPKLPTPPKERPATQLPAVKVPPLKLGGVGGGAAAAPVADENSNAGNAAGHSGAADKAAGKAKKGGSMHFLPGKKLVRKQAVPSAAPQLALDLPLSSRGETSALPRLPFDAVNDDMDVPGSRGMVAL